jgi:cell division protein FtsI/penicillin-binding protein 2
LETAGRINRNDFAKGLQLATFGFGQSMNVTPVALIGAFGALANRGVRMEPRLIKRIGATDSLPSSTGRILGADACDAVLKCMREVIDSDRGTGKSLRIAGYEMGGKTGTAQKITKGPSNKKRYVSNFVGFIPAYRPKAVILVMIDDPEGQYYGASVAGPVFRDLARFTVERLRLPKTSQSVPAGPAEEPPKATKSHPKASSAVNKSAANSSIKKHSPPVVNVDVRPVRGQ